MAALVLVAGCGGGSTPVAEAPEGLGLTDLDAEVELAEEHVPTEAQVEIASVLEEAIDVLFEQPSLVASFDGVSEGYRTEGSVEIDPSTGDYHSIEHEVHDTGAQVASERYVIGDELHVRIGQGADGFDSDEFAILSLGAVRTKFVDESLTLMGRAGPSLDRVLAYHQSLPFEHVEIAPEDLGEGAASGYQIIFDSVDLAQFLRTNNLETLSPRDPVGPTIYEFWIDDAGMLMRLAIGGVQFHDGEAIEDFGGAITYEAAPPRTITAP